MVFNWLVDGYKLLKLEGLEVTKSVMKATQEYREESDTFGAFLREVIIEVENARLQTSKLYTL